MTTPLSSGHEVDVDGSAPAVDRLRARATNARTGVHRRGARHTAAPSPCPALRCDETLVRATWRGALGRCELCVQTVPHGLQVRQCTWLDSGSVLEEAFMLHARDEFEQWHAAAPTKFDHPVAHDEIRRFAEAKLLR